MTNTAADGINTVLGQSLLFGPVFAHAWNTDVQTFFPDGYVGAGSYRLPDAAHSPILPAFNTVKFKVVSLGFEIRDTTADVFKQGTITTCRTSNKPVYLPNLASGLAGNKNVVSADVADRSPIRPIISSGFELHQLPPVTLSDAMVNQGIQRKAADGAYCVSHVSNDRNDAHSAIPKSFFWSTGGRDTVGIDAVLTPNNTTTGFVAINQESSAPAPDEDGNWIVGPRCSEFHLSPRDNVTCYLTGLNPNSTFTITTSIGIVFYPRMFDSGYQVTVPMAKVGPAFDPSYELILDNIRRTMPSSVPVDMNPSGEFWGMLVRGAGTIASMLLPKVGPIGALAAPVVNTIAQRVANMIEKRDAPVGGTVQGAPRDAAAAAVKNKAKQKSTNKGKSKAVLRANNTSVR